jgi:tetratricopeptide (TPR) repeat protein
VVPFEAQPLGVRLENAVLAYAGYLGQMLWPWHLAVYYPYPGPAIPFAPVLVAGLLLAVVTALVLGPARDRPYLAVGWLWYLGTLVPVIGLVQVGGQAMADRYTYVPLIGVFLMLTWGAADLAAAWRLPRYSIGLTTAVVLSACAAMTWTQVGYWESTLRLWERAVAVTENNVLAHMNLGMCYRERGTIFDAKGEFEKAVAINPALAEPHVNLGSVLADLGQPERAAAEYRAAIDLEPTFAGAHFNLGIVLAQSGRYEEAMAEYRTAIHLDPTIAGPHANLGQVLRDLGRLEDSVAEFRTAIQLDPRDASDHNDLGIVLAELGRHEEAVAEFRTAIDLVPRNPVPHTNLGSALQGEGRLEEALAEYHKALERGDNQALPRLQACEVLRGLAPRLPGLVAGQDQPADNAERLAFADLCRQRCRSRYALAARLYTDAFRADARLAEDLRAAHRFHAACAAAAAGCGQGEDAAGLDEQEKARLRCQALDWLRAELAVWTRHARSDQPQGRAGVQRALRTWQREDRLAGVRDPALRTRLPAAERDAWQQLWHEVQAVLEQAGGSQKT